MRRTITGFLVVVTLAATVHAAEFHVAVNGSNANAGTRTRPFRTIQHAADLAQPGDVITVHEGVYRERINPPRGGTSEKARIVYRAARGEKVEIKGSEAIKDWVKVQGDVWKTTLPNSFFGGFNPYNDLIHGDWFSSQGRQHHTGAVYLNGEWLVEAAKLEEVLAPGGTAPAWLGRLGRDEGKTPGLWFAQVGDSTTTIYAQFLGVNPKEQRVEINVRQAVFFPDKPGRNYITVRGFTLRDAATPWAPPTAGQIGLIGTHWSKGWIIENNHVSHSTCSGIALGKYSDQYDNTSADTAEGYVKTIERAHQNGWNRETIGHHIVRNNTISHCEQAGIVGSLGAAFSTVTGNTIHDIHVRRLFSGAEMAGIKFHAAIDTTIANNHIYRTCLGLWLDWMAQGTRVSGNLFHENDRDLFVEVNHGPFLVDNNLFLSPGNSLLDVSEGGAFVHNLFLGTLQSSPEPNRETPFHPPHTTAVAGLATTKGGDCRFYNNIFVGRGETPQKSSARFGLASYDKREYPLYTGGNVFYNGAQPYARETEPVLSLADPQVKLLKEGNRLSLQFRPGPELKQAKTRLITTELLGKAKVSGLPYENADGSPLKIGADYFGKKRSAAHPTPGPFEKVPAGEVQLPASPAETK